MRAFCDALAPTVREDARESVAPRATDRRLREASWRGGYLQAALMHVPRLLTAVDRNPFRPTYGCFDRQYWHYRTAAFPSEMYQEGVLPLAQVYAYRLPGNPWHGEARLRELAVAGLRFAARSSHADGSCDDYYPYERALGAAVFSLAAATKAYQVLALDDAEIVGWFEKRSNWLSEHDETGRLANHQALAAVGLCRVAEITGEPRYREAAAARVARVLKWQHAEGWFDEYGGADPGYQTATIESLAVYRQMTGDGVVDEPLRRAVKFAALFLHPDGSFGGEYGSRGTYHWYPHGLELLAREMPAAADLADGFLKGWETGRQACFDDDRLVAHRLGSLIEAYRDWSASRPAVESPAEYQASYEMPGCGMWVQRRANQLTIVSTARGGVWKHFGGSGTARAAGDAGLMVEFDDGRRAASQLHELKRDVSKVRDESTGLLRSVSVEGPLHWVRFETATPLTQALLHVGMWGVGRWLRGPVRWLLQRRLITGRRACGMTLLRRFEWIEPEGEMPGATLRVTDTIRLTDRRLRVRRMAYGSDHQVSYVAAANVYQDAVLQAWTELTEWVERLNRDRAVSIVREW